MNRPKIIKVYIGRFQPFHLGHLQVLRAAAATADHTVVIVGSTNAPQTIKNPFSYDARKAMIEATLTPMERKVVTVTGQEDKPGSDAEWVKDIKAIARDIATKKFPGEALTFTLIGCHKDASSYYLKLYRGWKLELVPHAEALNATDTRRRFFEQMTWPYWAEDLPPASAAYLAAFKEYQPAAYATLVAEWEKDRHAKAMVNMAKFFEVLNAAKAE